MSTTQDPQKDQQPLASLDPNKRLSAVNPLSDMNTKPMPAYNEERKQHQMLHSKIADQFQTGQQHGSYVSPSDDILSPASAKLNALKEKRFSKTAKSRLLFGSGPPRSGMSNSVSAEDA